MHKLILEISSDGDLNDLMEALEKWARKTKAFEGDSMVRCSIDLYVLKNGRYYTHEKGAKVVHMPA